MDYSVVATCHAPARLLIFGAVVWDVGWVVLLAFRHSHCTYCMPTRCTPQAPILVHCSAGIGRTGTFMAIDIGMQELQSEWRVTDIKGNVEKMRKERGGSVQTPIQYKFIHQALEEYCKPGQKHSMFGTNKPRSVVLQTSNQYPYLGFTARGSHPAFVVSVDVGGLAELQGVRAGDHILEINGINAMQLSHKQVRIRRTRVHLAHGMVRACATAWHWRVRTRPAALSTFLCTPELYCLTSWRCLLRCLAGACRRLRRSSSQAASWR